MIVTTLERPAYLKTPEEYLMAERIGEQRHEYLAGTVCAMAGTNRDHERIAINICGELHAQLRDRPCEVLASNIKLGIKKEAAQFFYYPDVTVDCGTAAGDSFFAEQPRVIFEILSPETERIDRVEKLYNYQTLRSLSVYVLVDQLRPAVTIYRRTNNEWAVELLTRKEDVLKLPEIECALRMTAIYERTDLLR
ncbi:MAG TPA: Uma2 family endonuclease [Candidatus Udaeobacter sp.]|nr:Uma2 family endonuclease [Candidatus Udaeobacter sp.]